MDSSNNEIVKPELLVIDKCCYRINPLMDTGGNYQDDYIDGK